MTLCQSLRLGPKRSELSHGGTKARSEVVFCGKASVAPRLRVRNNGVIKQEWGSRGATQARSEGSVL
jgi:hypothetical protein